jgi:transposase
LQIRSVPGRKTDVNDAMWIADLLAHGLIRSSFVPPAAIHELRDLTRTRKQLVREVAQHTLRIHKVLEDANLKLTSVLSDVMGMSGRAMIEAIIRGEEDPERLADLSQGRLKASRPAVIAALQGHVTPHHRFLLRLHLTQIDALEVAVRDVEARLGEALAPFQAAVDRLMTIPAVGPTVARVIAAEIGFDMSRFPTAGHLVSWAGLCPRQQESAGKRLSTRRVWLHGGAENSYSRAYSAAFVALRVL